MLGTIVTIYREPLTALAESWLTAGATCFELWDDEQLLARWPLRACPEPVVLVVPVQSGTVKIGELRIAGHVGETAAAQLAASAALLAHLARLEQEQEIIVAELIEVQDQLLTVYELTQSACYHDYYADVEQLLHCLASEIARLLKVDKCFILMDMGGRHWEVCHPLSSDSSLPKMLLIEQYAKGTELLLNRHERGSEILPAGVENLLYVPIQVRASIKASLGLANKPGGFASPDLKLARTIAEQAGGRIENFLLHQETLEQARLHIEMQMARQIQQRLMPQHLPEIDGLDIYADWRPARQASGDFYDLIVRPDRPFLFAIGDVSGKGMPAALITVETMTEIRSQSKILLDPNPAAMMRGLNEELYSDFTRAEMLATVFIGQYDMASRELRYANAGHAPVIYCPYDGPPRLIQAKDPPIGVLPIIAYQRQSLLLRSGDILLITTDGFTEAFNPEGTMFGYERMLSLLATLREQSVHAIASNLFAAVEQFSARTEGEQELSDDQAILVLKVTGPGQAACVDLYKMVRLDLPASLEYLGVLGTTVQSMLREESELKDPEKTAHALHLALHELCANIIEHAYAKEHGHMAITLTLALQPQRFIAEMLDTGCPFDPTLVPEPDLLSEHGRGLALLRSLMDEITYYARTGRGWKSNRGEAWQQLDHGHPQPGRNYWYLVKWL